ncbi:hypothetical protein HIM_06364 [Hirsutella minnesotensis 3608]|uniref:Uncharacterized protein n=1 Tax=Hirsutella minnesotensis 3608 TaxID=1043627 RepID=A0A0F7ZU27_9HYPO|nr:hypothetical protein HIM_06364 [Hirsutella minnesotensis 3608]
MARGECWLPPETAARLVPLDGGEGAAILRWGRTSCGAPRLPAKAEAKPIPFDGSEGPAALHVGFGRMSRGTSELLVGGGEGPPALHVGCDRMSRGASELLVVGGEGRISLGTRWPFPEVETAPGPPSGSQCPDALGVVLAVFPALASEAPPLTPLLALSEGRRDRVPALL